MGFLRCMLGAALPRRIVISSPLMFFLLGSFNSASSAFLPCSSQLHCSITVNMSTWPLCVSLSFFSTHLFTPLFSPSYTHEMWTHAMFCCGYYTYKLHLLVSVSDTIKTSF